MGSESWKYDIGFEKQSSFDAKAPGDGASKQFLRFFGKDDIWMTPEIIDLTGTESTRDRVDFAAGVYKIRGRRIPDIEIVPDRCSTLLECLFGSVTGSNPYTFTPDNTLPYFTIWKRVGDIYLAVVGCKIESAEFTFGAGVLKVSVEIRGRHIEEIEVGNFPQIVHSDKKPFVFHHLTVSYGGSEVAVKDASITIANGLPDDDFYSGSVYTHEHTAGVRSIAGRFRVTFDSYSKMEEFISSAERALSFEIKSPHGDTLSISLPRVALTADVAVDESENLYRITMPFIAYKPDTGNIISAVLTTV